MGPRRFSLAQLLSTVFRFAGPWRLMGETWLQVFTPRR